MTPAERGPACPRCGHDMRVMPETDWTLHGMRTVDAICPNCLHTERIWAIEARREDRR